MNNSNTSDKMEEGPSPATTTTAMDTVNLSTVGDDMEVDMMEGKDEEGRRKKLVKAGLLIMLLAVVTYVVLDYTVSCHVKKCTLSAVMSRGLMGIHSQMRRDLGMRPGPTCFCARTVLAGKAGRIAALS